MTAHAVHAAHANRKFHRVMTVPKPILAFETDKTDKEITATEGSSQSKNLEKAPKAQKSWSFYRWLTAVKAGVVKAWHWYQGLPQIADLKLPWGFTGEGFVLSFQQAVALAAATIVHVCPASYKALNGNTIWCVITVAVLAQKSVGGVALKSVNRLIGTILAGITGIG